MRNNYWKYIMNNTVDVLLIVIAVVLVVLSIVRGTDVSLYILILALNMVCNLINNVRLFKRINETIKDPLLRKKLGL